MRARPEDLGRPLTHLAIDSVEAAYNVFVESVRELAEYAGARGIKFLIENHVVAPFNLVNGKNRILFASTGEEIRRLANDVGSPHLQILLDVGHLKVTAKSLHLNAYQAIEKVSDLIAAFHLSDNDGDSDQNLPFSSDAWFMPILKDFRKATYIIEAYNLDVKTIRACEDALAKL
jgi:sugar phosphate isomerase/epimerase